MTIKVTYKTDNGLVFNTIIPCGTTDSNVMVATREYVNAYMQQHYNFNSIEVLNHRLSKKVGYSKVCNKQVKFCKVCGDSGPTVCTPAANCLNIPAEDALREAASAASYAFCWSILALSSIKAPVLADA